MKTALKFWIALPGALLRELTQGEITMRAMGLVYTTLLSIAPLLALSFSVLKGFGVHNQLEPFLLQFMAPLGQKAQEVTTQVLGFVDNIQVGALGVAGLAALLYTVLMMMQQIENAFNHLWQLPNNRAFHQQFTKYLSVIMVAPILLFTMLGVFSSLSHTALGEHLSTSGIWNTFLRIIPSLFVIFVFTFIYIFIPNTRVRFVPALGAGIIAGLAWQLGGWIFASFVVSSGSQTAIYSVFAGLFLFMLWMYISWIIVLLGARLAYYLQYPEAVFQVGQPDHLSVESRELLTTAVLREIGSSFIKGQMPLSLEDLRARIPISRLLLNQTLQDLIQYGILSQEKAKTPRYLLRVSPDLLTVNYIRHCLWQGDSLQQAQAQQIRKATRLDDEGLERLHEKPELTIKELLDRRITKDQEEPPVVAGSADAEPLMQAPLLQTAPETILPATEPEAKPAS
jgi:membrane protein